MSVIRTKTNMVCAYEPQPNDLFVRVDWHGPDEDGRHLRAFEGALLPIEEYQAAVDWALTMADQMRFPLHVVPRRAEDVLTADYLDRYVASLTDQERGELRRAVIAATARVLRDCGSSKVRSEAYGVLVQLGVVR